MVLEKMSACTLLSVRGNTLTEMRRRRLTSTFMNASVTTTLHGWLLGQFSHSEAQRFYIYHRLITTWMWPSAFSSCIVFGVNGCLSCLNKSYLPDYRQVRNVLVQSRHLNAIHTRIHECQITEGSRNLKNRRRRLMFCEERMDMQ